MDDTDMIIGRDITKYALHAAQGVCAALNGAVRRGVIPRDYNDPEGVSEVVRSIARKALDDPRAAMFDPALCVAIQEAMLTMIEHPCADNGYRYVARESVAAVFVDKRPASQTPKKGPRR